MLGLLFLLICLPLVKGENDDVCGEGQTNYTTKENRVIVKAYNTTEKTWTVIHHDCDIFEVIFSWFSKGKCTTVRRQETKTVIRNETTTEDYLVHNCCPGYVNNSNICEKGCPVGTYGENCTSNCSCPSYCDQQTGECICKAGTHGENCSLECDASHYGINCKHECTCENNSTCNHTDGSCNCTSPGWQGSRCNDVCTNDTYGLFCNESCQCNINQTCDSVNGSCTCKSGWEGENCTQECADMTYGAGCKENCTCYSTNTESCDRSSGDCNCLPGYIDKDCSKECPLGLFGKDCRHNCSERCTHTDYCDHENGTCICLGAHGPNCTEECDVGKYGPDCTLNCSCINSLNDSCHNMTGQCECIPGWIGRTCDRKCDDGNYGPNCEFDCNCTNSMNESCNNVTGQCTCKPGWTGRVCDRTVPKNGTLTDTGGTPLISSVTLMYVILPAIGLLLVLVAIFVAIYSRRRTERKRLKKERQSFSAQANPSYNPGDAEDIPLKNGSSDSKQHLYEDAVLEVGNQRNPDIDVQQTEDSDDETKLKDHTYKESKESELVENEYSLADEEFKTDEHLGEIVKDRQESKQEELYDTTNEGDSTMEDIRNEYNTFEDVRKINIDASKKKTEIEEDYDVIAPGGSFKKKVEDMENYSSFEQVRKLSLQDGNEEEMYNVLNETQPKHRSSPFNDSSYHHISLKDNTIDGEALTSHTAKRASNNLRLARADRKQGTPFIAKSESIDEESEDEEKAVTEMPEVRKQDEKHENHEICNNEVIYDECDLDDESGELKLETSKTDPKSVNIDSETTEVVYEECDNFVEDELRPPSGAVYEDVSDEEKETKEDKENKKPIDNSCRSENGAGVRLKKRSQRRREDYEEFDL